jgi:hypothetical protein
MAGPSEPKPAVAWNINYALKAKYALYSTLVFFLVANPETYKLLQKFLGRWVDIAGGGGCPTPVGFFIHTGLFFLIFGDSCYSQGICKIPRDYEQR